MSAIEDLLAATDAIIELSQAKTALYAKQIKQIQASIRNNHQYLMENHQDYLNAKYHEAFEASMKIADESLASIAEFNKRVSN